MIGNIYGINVFVSPDLPKMQLSEGCPVTPEFRIEMNAWMLEFFGTRNAIPDGEYWLTAQTVHMNPRTYARFKAITL